MGKELLSPGERHCTDLSLMAEGNCIHRVSFNIWAREIKCLEGLIGRKHGQTVVKTQLILSAR